MKRFLSRMLIVIATMALGRMVLDMARETFWENPWTILIVFLAYAGFLWLDPE